MICNQKLDIPFGNTTKFREPQDLEVRFENLGRIFRV